MQTADVNQHRTIPYPLLKALYPQRVTSYDVRYKFTGKERDQETGYDYFRSTRTYIK